ncbi:MAG TPA: ABC transporter substrate-binding protein [Nitrolancea sp.]
MDRFLGRASEAMHDQVSTRRQFVKRSAFFLSIPVVGALLTACGGSNNKSTSASTSSSSSGGSTAAAAASPTAEQVVPTVSVNQNESTPTAASTGSGAPKKGGDMVWVGHQELAGLSPNDVGPSDQWDMITQIHNALLEQDENFVLQPTLAKTFEAAADGLSYTYKLVENVKFHDGTIFSSDDVKYTYTFYSDASNGSLIASYFANMDSVDASDPTTVVVKMKAPNAAFAALGSTTFIVPAKYHQQVGEKTYRTKPIGTGPFKLKEFISADHTTVERFDDHFRGAPHLDTITEKLVAEPSVRKIALETGQADSSVWTLLAQDDLELTKDTAKFTSFVSVSTAVNHFPINDKLPFFAQKECRQAMMHAIDRQKVIDTVFHGAAVVATANLAPNLAAWYNKDVTTYDYDVDKAKTMLDSAGWAVGSDGVRAKGGQRFSFTCAVISGDQARKPEAELVQQYLKAVGIEMKIQEQPATQIIQNLPLGKLDASLFNWTYGGANGEPDASDTLKTGAGSNFSSYSNPQVDQLLDQGLAEPDINKRKPIYDQIQKIVADDVPFIYMMYWNWFNHFSKRVQGLPKSALNSGQLYNKAYQWWFA